MKLYQCLPLLLTFHAALGTAPDPNPNGVVSVLTYLPSTSNGPCVASSPSDEGTFVRMTHDACPTNPQVFHVTKGNGAPSWPWASETFFVESGWVKDLDDASWRWQDGTCTAYRDFRTLSSGRKGFQWMPTSFPLSTGQAWSTSPYVDERWGHLVEGSSPPSYTPDCWGTHYANYPGTVTGGQVEYVLLSGYLTDRRSTPAFFGSTDVAAVKLTFHWTSGQGTVTEIHYYGKFFDSRPTVNGWVGLGEVGFESYGGGTTTINDATGRALVDCNPFVECSTCPDP